MTAPLPDRLAAALADRYRLERKLGEGGMATVYLAHDLKHDRDVAIKVLHPDLGAALGGERFLTEIRTTARLQHPHILPLLDSGEAEGLLYYVMPFVAGETLRARLEREQQLPLADALQIATEVADALSAAHAIGIIHRDIKPENILLQGGHAQVADFGIALAVQSAGSKRMTQTGLSLGTPQYMSPEQAMGEKAVDIRTDIYALGAVTYEMLTGDPPFTGSSVHAIVAKVLNERPTPPTTVRDTIPPRVEAAVLTALAKLPADRFGSAKEFAGALGRARRPSGQIPWPPPPPARPAGRRTLTAAAAGIAAGLVLGGLLIWFLRAAPAPPPVPAVTFTIGADTTHRIFGVGAVSPDGRTLVYPVADGAGSRLYARRLDEVESREIPGTAGAFRAFFSPDGAWIGFLTYTELAKIRLDGGRPTSLASVTARSGSGGIWMDDGTIIFTDGLWGIYRLPPEGGLPQPVAFGDSTLRPLLPSRLPDERRILFTAWPIGVPGGQIATLDLSTGAIRTLGEGTGATFVAPDRIIFSRNDGRLYAQPFDPARGDTIGPAFALGGPPALIPDLSFLPEIAVGRNGTIIALGGSTERRLVLADRRGRQTTLVRGSGLWVPRFSPEMRRIAFGAFTPPALDADLWLYNLQGGTSHRLTYEGVDSNDPLWSPDGNTLLYSTTLDGKPKDLYRHSLTGSGPDRLLLSMPGAQWPSDWSRDGRFVVFTNTVSPTTGWDLWVAPVDSADGARAWLATPFREAGGRFSPDGRWIAYTSNETGQPEVYVQSFPAAGNKAMISIGGGRDPVWRGDGRELYYWQGHDLIAAHLDPTVPLTVRSREMLFRMVSIEGAHANYDSSPDGRQFVVVTDGGESPYLVVRVNALEPR